MNCSSPLSPASYVAVSYKPVKDFFYKLKIECDKYPEVSRAISHSINLINLKKKHEEENRKRMDEEEKKKLRNEENGEKINNVIKLLETLPLYCKEDEEELKEDIIKNVENIDDSDLEKIKEIVEDNGKEDNGKEENGKEENEKEEENDSEKKILSVKLYDENENDNIKCNKINSEISSTSITPILANSSVTSSPNPSLVQSSLPSSPRSSISSHSTINIPPTFSLSSPDSSQYYLEILSPFFILFNMKNKSMNFYLNLLNGVILLIKNNFFHVNNSIIFLNLLKLLLSHTSTITFPNNPTSISSSSSSVSSCFLPLCSTSLISNSLSSYSNDSSSSLMSSFFSPNLSVTSSTSVPSSSSSSTSSILFLKVIQINLLIATLCLKREKKSEDELIEKENQTEEIKDKENINLSLPSSSHSNSNILEITPSLVHSLFEICIVLSRSSSPSTSILSSQSLLDCLASSQTTSLNQDSVSLAASGAIKQISSLLFENLSEVVEERNEYKDEEINDENNEINEDYEEKKSTLTFSNSSDLSFSSISHPTSPSTSTHTTSISTSSSITSSCAFLFLSLISQCENQLNYFSSFYFSFELLFDIFDMFHKEFLLKVKLRKILLENFSNFLLNILSKIKNESSFFISLSSPFLSNSSTSSNSSATTHIFPPSLASFQTKFLNKFFHLIQIYLLNYNTKLLLKKQKKIFLTLISFIHPINTKEKVGREKDANKENDKEHSRDTEKVKVKEKDREKLKEEEKWSLFNIFGTTNREKEREKEIEKKREEINEELRKEREKLREHELDICLNFDENDEDSEKNSLSSSNILSTSSSLPRLSSSSSSTASPLNRLPHSLLLGHIMQTILQFYYKNLTLLTLKSIEERAIMKLGDIRKNNNIDHNKRISCSDNLSYLDLFSLTFSILLQNYFFFSQLLRYLEQKNEKSISIFIQSIEDRDREEMKRNEVEEEDSEESDEEEEDDEEDQEERVLEGRGERRRRRERQRELQQEKEREKEERKKENLKEILFLKEFKEENFINLIKNFNTFFNFFTFSDSNTSLFYINSSSLSLSSFLPSASSLYININTSTYLWLISFTSLRYFSSFLSSLAYLSSIMKKFGEEKLEENRHNIDEEEREEISINFSRHFKKEYEELLFQNEKNFLKDTYYIFMRSFSSSSCPTIITSNASSPHCTSPASPTMSSISCNCPSSSTFHCYNQLSSLVFSVPPYCLITASSFSTKKFTSNSFYDSLLAKFYTNFSYFSDSNSSSALSPPPPSLSLAPLLEMILLNQTNKLISFSFYPFEIEEKLKQFLSSSSSVILHNISYLINNNLKNNSYLLLLSSFSSPSSTSTPTSSFSTPTSSSLSFSLKLLYSSFLFDFLLLTTLTNNEEELSCAFNVLAKNIIGENENNQHLLNLLRALEEEKNMRNDEKNLKKEEKSQKYTQGKLCLKNEERGLIFDFFLYKLNLTLYYLKIIHLFISNTKKSTSILACLNRYVRFFFLFFDSLIKEKKNIFFFLEDGEKDKEDENENSSSSALLSSSSSSASLSSSYISFASSPVSHILKSLLLIIELLTKISSFTLQFNEEQYEDYIESLISLLLSSSTSNSPLSHPLPIPFLSSYSTSFSLTTSLPSSLTYYHFHSSSLSPNSTPHFPPPFSSSSEEEFFFKHLSPFLPQYLLTPLLTSSLSFSHVLLIETAKMNKKRGGKKWRSLILSFLTQLAMSRVS